MDWNEVITIATRTFLKMFRNTKEMNTTSESLSIGIQCVLCKLNLNEHIRNNWYERSIAIGIITLDNIFN